MLQILEMRLDNVVFQLGFGSTRAGRAADGGARHM
jgi:ribosomal protein S4